MKKFEIFETLLEPTFIINKEGIVLFCNEPAAIIVGKNRRRIQNKTKFNDLISFSTPVEYLDKIDKITDPTPYKEVNFTTPEGGKGKVQITLQPYFDNNEWLVYLRDVTLEETLQAKYRQEFAEKEAMYVELEQSYIGLEKIVAERTEEITKLNKQMSGLLNSLNEGFFIFDKNGKCQDVSSQSCLNTIEKNPNGQYLWDVFHLDSEDKDNLIKWLQILFDEKLPFEDIAILGPDRYKHSQGNIISLKYFPIRDEKNKVESVVVMSSDITSLIEAQRQAEFEKQKAQLIINLLNNRIGFSIFLRDSKKLIKELEDLVKGLNPKSNHEEVLRNLHTLKGGAATYNAPLLAEKTHEAESLYLELIAAWDKNYENLFIEKFNSVCEEFKIFIDQVVLVAGSSILSEEKIFEITFAQAKEMASLIERSKNTLEAAFHYRTQMFNVPIEKFIEPYNRVIHLTSEKLNKKVYPIKVINGHIRIPPIFYSNLFSTLVHAFRNAIDHGIESPDERVKMGKSEVGSISVQAIEFNSQLHLIISDDGKGIDPKIIREKLESKKISCKNETDEQVIQHIFDSQFTTKSEVSEVSGRGVGMDAIKKAAEEIGGKAWVESKLGVGSSLHIRVPLRLEVDEAKQSKVA